MASSFPMQTSRPSPAKRPACFGGFWAPWLRTVSGHGTVIDELAGEYTGQIKVAKMNVDENPATPGRYGCRAIPTLILFKGGEVIEQITGAVPRAASRKCLPKRRCSSCDTMTPS